MVLVKVVLNPGWAGEKASGLRHQTPNLLAQKTIFQRWAFCECHWLGGKPERCLSFFPIPSVSFWGLEKHRATQYQAGDEHLSLFSCLRCCLKEDSGVTMSPGFLTFWSLPSHVKVGSKQSQLSLVSWKPPAEKLENNPCSSAGNITALSCHPRGPPRTLT